MSLVAKPYKKRKLKMDAASIARRKAYKKTMAKPGVAMKRAKVAKVWRKKNKTILAVKASLTNKARKRK